MYGALLTSLLQKLSTWTSRASTSSSADPTSSAEQELQNLENTVRMIDGILEDAEEKGVSDESEQLHLRELREVAYDAEDVLDEYEYEVLHMKLEARRQAILANHMCSKIGKVTFDWNSFRPKVSISDELAGRIKGIRKRFEEINDWKSTSLCLLEKGGKRRRINKWKPAESASYYDEDKTFGREDEKSEIIKWLLQEEEVDEVSILGIVGMGGIGKTTLAQMAYSDTRVCQYFNLRGWVYVSEEFNIASLVKKIYNSFNMYRDVNYMSLDEIHMTLKMFLDGKKFFLVLDDVWNLNFEMWSSLKNLLVGIGVGRILVTTRDERFVNIMQTSPPIYLGKLSYNDSWMLFKKIACEGRDQDFLEIGKKIVHKCKGLPLAIKVLAGILRKEDEEETCNDVLENELSELDELENDVIFPVLKLSYDRLPIELRQCFMYLCLFPKGSKLEKSVIVQQWMSHGFIQSKESKMEEDVGDDICNEFMYRSILQLVGERISKDLFIMHDLIHDLAQSVAKDEYLLITTPKFHNMITKTLRHISVHIMNESEIINLEPLCEAKHLRTLILNVHGRIPITNLLPNLTRLRTLSLFKGHMELPNSIGELKHLRYLDFGFPEFIPSLYNLHYLQTLKNSMFNIKLSQGVGDLINLRHLFGYSKDYLPREVAGLTNLQTLATFTVGVESEEACKVRDLKGLQNLRVYLEVRGLETVAWPDVSPPEAYLKDKPGIKYLVLKWGCRAQQKVAAVDERLAARVLDTLQPSCSLEYLSISRYPGVVLPAWLGHELPALKSLQIAGMKSVKSFVLLRENKGEVADASAAVSKEEDAESHWFPSLQDLTLKNMHELEEWPGAEDRDLPCLRHLTISGCPKLRTLPTLSRLVGLSICDCPVLRSLPPLPSLSKLCINECDSELLFGRFCLPALRSLTIYYYSSASLIFPGDRSLLGPLDELTIQSCLALTSVEGLGLLTSLQNLVIFDCPLLRISPEERLPPNLQRRELYNSPGAVEWYQNQVLSASECQTSEDTQKSCSHNNV